MPMTAHALRLENVIWEIEDAKGEFVPASHQILNDLGFNNHSSATIYRLESAQSKHHPRLKVEIYNKRKGKRTNDTACDLIHQHSNRTTAPVTARYQHQLLLKAVHPYTIAHKEEPDLIAKIAIKNIARKSRYARIMCKLEPAACTSIDIVTLEIPPKVVEQK